MITKRNIAEIAAQKLCHTCGACSAVCPCRAIEYRETVGGYFFPVVDQSACTLCGRCLAVCAGIRFGDTLKAQMPADPFVGRALDAYVGTAGNPELLANAQSGGLVSALLVHALEAGLIKGALTVVMEPGSPPRPVPRIARSREEIVDAQKSKYCPVPLLDAVTQWPEADGPIAVVGLPCQIHGLRNMLDTLPALQRRIAITIGLVCDRVMTYAAMDYLMHAARADGQQPAMLHFRDKSVSGYPGDVHVLSGNGRSVVLPAAARMRIKDAFTPARCRICFDKMNVYADLTVGDPHGLSDIDRQQGESMLVIRTTLGKDFVTAARAAAAIHIRPRAYQQVVSGQNIKAKRIQWRGYIEAWGKSGRDIPNYADAVKLQAPLHDQGNQYLKRLKLSWGLDGSRSRADLVRRMGRRIRRQRWAHQLLRYLSVCKKTFVSNIQ